MSKLSPINNMIKKNQLKVNTSSLLQKYSQNTKTDEQLADEQEVPEDKINSITISNFKSNKLSQIDKR